MGAGAWSWAVAAGAAAAMALVAAGGRNSSGRPWVGALTMTAILLRCWRWRFRSNRPKGSPKTEDDTPALEDKDEVWMPLDGPSGEKMSLYMPQTADVMDLSSDLSIVSADDYLVPSPHEELTVPAVGAQDDSSVMEGQPAEANGAQRFMAYDKYLSHPKLTSPLRLQVLRAKASVQKFYQTD